MAKARAAAHTLVSYRFGTRNTALGTREFMQANDAYRPEIYSSLLSMCPVSRTALKHIAIQHFPHMSMKH